MALRNKAVNAKASEISVLIAILIVDGEGSTKGKLEGKRLGYISDKLARPQVLSNHTACLPRLNPTEDATPFECHSLPLTASSDEAKDGNAS
jgi:hypothetical protein